MSSKKTKATQAHFGYESDDDSVNALSPQKKNKKASKNKATQEVNQGQDATSQDATSTDDKKNAKGEPPTVDPSVKESNESDPHGGESNAAPHGVHSTPSQIQTAQEILERAQREINEDIKQAYAVIMKHGTKRPLLWHLIDRFLSKIDRQIEEKASFIERKMRSHWNKGRLHFMEKPFTKDNAGLTSARQVKQIIVELSQFVEKMSKINSIANESSFRQDLSKLLDSSLVMEIHLQQLEQSLGVNVMKVKIAPQQWNKLRQIKARNDIPYYTIGIFGMEKAAKSTFANCLIKLDLLPTRETRCTFVLTTVFFDKTLPDAWLVEVQFYGQEEFEKNLKKLELLKDESFNLQEIRSEYENIKKLYPKLAFDSRGSCEDVRAKLSLVADKQLMHIVSTVVIKTNTLDLPFPLMMIDVPGFDSPIEEHRIMARDLVKKLDAFIFVADGTKPDPNNMAEALFKSLRDEGGAPLFEKGFAFCNQLDACATAEQATKSLKDGADRLMKYGFLRDHIFGGSTAYELVTLSKEKKFKFANQENENNLISWANRMQNFGELKNGIRHGINKVKEFVGTKLPLSRAQDALPILKDLLKTGKRIETTVDGLFVDEEGSGEKFVSKKQDEQWISLWPTYYQKALKSVRHWRYENVNLIHDQVFDGILTEFQANLDKQIQDPKSFSDNLKESIPHLPAVVAIADVEHLELALRDELFKYHLQQVESCCQAISDLSWQKCYQFVCQFTSQLGLSEGFVLSLVDVDQNSCYQQISALVMRVAYPACIATMKYRRLNPLREAAADELRSACPEIPVEDIGIREETK